MMVTYGLEAVCRIASPVPITNKPIRKTQYVRVYAAGIKIRVPTAIIKSPRIIPFLNPERSSTQEDGNAITV